MSASSVVVNKNPVSLSPILLLLRENPFCNYITRYVYRSLTLMMIMFLGCCILWIVIVLVLKNAGEA